MKSPLVKSLISLLQKCTLKGRSQRLVGKQPTLTVLIVLINIFFLLSYKHCSPIGNGCNSTATKSRTQDSTQGTQLQNKWVIPIFLNPYQLLFTYITRLQKFPLLFFLCFLQHPCAKPCPSKTWARLRSRGRTSPSTAVCLWPLLSWCSPQGFRGFMASKLVRNHRSTVTKLHACCGWVVSFDKTEMLRGQGTAEEEQVGLRARRSGTLRHRGQPPEVKTPFWLVLFFKNSFSIES